nr:PilZ domain-containing protein [Pseudenhygromyxa sp. WMMC2535]
MLHLASPKAGGRIVLPSREEVAIGDSVCVEISFGPLADELVLLGEVASRQHRAGRAPLLELRFGGEHDDQLRYLHDVLTHQRKASARASRRACVEIPARWSSSLGPQRAEIADISRGGAFLRSRTPPIVGSSIELEIEDASSQSAPPLRVTAVVAWIGRSHGKRGFGVKFRVGEREVAARVSALVRWHEQGSGR